MYASALLAALSDDDVGSEEPLLDELLLSPFNSPFDDRGSLFPEGYTGNSILVDIAAAEANDEGGGEG